MLRLIGMALFAVLMCTNFASCSSSDELDNNEESGSTNEKRLVEMIEVDDDETTTIKFNYDNLGRLSIIQTIINSRGKEYKYNDAYEWNNNTIVYEDEGRVSTAYISNGVITKEETIEGNWIDTEELKYDSSNRITSLNDNPFTWNGNKIIKVGKGSNIIEYSYTGIKHKGWAPTLGSDSSLWGTIQQYLGVDDLIFAHPELLGIKYCELPSKRKVYYSDNDIETTIISYTFYDDGYVKTRIEVDNDGYEKHYTYKWE